MKLNIAGCQLHETLYESSLFLLTVSWICSTIIERNSQDCIFPLNPHFFWYVNGAMDLNTPIKVVFFRTERSSEPVRKWLKEFSREDRKTIEEDIKNRKELPKVIWKFPGRDWLSYEVDRNE